MSTIVWPNWVDLVVLSVVVRTSYSGFHRGPLAEFFSLFGLVSATACSCFFYAPVADMLQPWLPMPATLLRFLTFLALLILSTVILMRFAARKLTELIKWDRMHWLAQLVGLVLGAVRGLWWCGLILLLALGARWSYLQQSILERSLSGARLVEASNQAFLNVTSLYAGGATIEHPVPALESGKHK